MHRLPFSDDARCVSVNALKVILSDTVGTNVSAKSSVVGVDNADLLVIAVDR